MANFLKLAVVKEINRLYVAGYSTRKTAAELGISKITVNKYYKEFRRLTLVPLGKQNGHSQV